jgi:hypothetical protein
VCTYRARRAADAATFGTLVCACVGSKFALASGGVPIASRIFETLSRAMRRSERRETARCVHAGVSAGSRASTSAAATHRDVLAGVELPVRVREHDEVRGDASCADERRAGRGVVREREEVHDEAVLLQVVPAAAGDGGEERAQLGGVLWRERRAHARLREQAVEEERVREEAAPAPQLLHHLGREREPGRGELEELRVVVRAARVLALYVSMRTCSSKDSYRVHSVHNGRKEEDEQRVNKKRRDRVNTSRFGNTTKTSI